MIDGHNLKIEDLINANTFSIRAKSDKLERKINLELAFEATDSSLQGVLEFGVMSGRTLSVLANLNSPNNVYGFDSFEGLPEQWIKNPNEVYDAGSFAVPLMALPDNAKLVKGWYCDTVPEWSKEHTDLSIKLLHIDCDLYSSTKDVLYGLNDKIVSNTIIVFDEMYNWNNPSEYPTWAEHEFKALKEWMIDHNRIIQPLFRSQTEQLTIRVC